MADNIFSSEQQEQMVELFKAFGTLTKETDPLIKAKQEEAKKAKEAADALKMLKQQLGSSVLDYNKALFSSGEGLGKFGGAITGATSAIGDWTSKLGLAGAVIGGFIKIFGDIAAKSLKQNDDLMKSYENLSDMGTVASGGLENLRDQLHQVGLMAEEAEKFERVLKPITGELAKFGGSVTQGRDRLVGVINGLIGPNNEMEQYLRRLGYSTQDIREGAADFVQRQTKLGLAQGKTQEQLVKESFKYMSTLKELQELTGMSRDEAQKAMDMQMADARFSLHLTKLKDEEATNLVAYLTDYEKKFGKEAAAGLKDIIVNEGRITTELAAASYQIAGNAHKESMIAMRKGTAYFPTAIQNVSTEIMKNVKRLEPAFMVQENGLREMGATNEAITGAMSVMGLRTNKAGEQIKALGEIGKTGTERQNQNIQNEQQMRAIRLAGDKALYEVGSLTVGMFTKLNEAMFGFGKTLAKVVDWMSTIVPGMEKTNYSALFRDITDNTKDLLAANKEKDILLKDLEDTKKQIAEAEKNKVDYAKQLREKQEEITRLSEQYRKETDTVKKRELYRQKSEEERKLKELEHLSRMSGRGKDGGIDKEVALNLRKSKVLELENKLLEQKQKVIELEKERMKFDPNYQATETGSTSSSGNNQSVNQSPAESKRLGLGSSNNALPASTSQILDFIGKYESRGDYNVLVGGQKANLTSMTIGEVLDMQSNLIKSGANSAAGKYQIKQSTLKGLIEQLGISKDQKFDQSMQDRLAIALLEEKGYSAFKSGKMSADDFADRLAQVWAALPTRTGYSQYQGDAQGNKSLVSRQSFMSMLDQSLHKSAIGSTFAGPKSGYPVMLHGNESVWPDKELKETLRQVQQSSLSQYKTELMGALGLKSKNLDLSNENIIQNMPDMKIIVDALKQEIPKLSIPANNTSRSEGIVEEVINLLTTKLDSLIEENRKSNDIQDQILTYTRA